MDIKVDIDRNLVIVGDFNTCTTSMDRSFRQKISKETAAWMKLESIMLSETSQEVRDKYHMISPLTGT